MRTETATNAKLHFGEILESSQREPIFIEKSGRKVAVVLSMSEYNRVMQMENEYYAMKAIEAQKEGFIGIEESEKFMQELLNAKD